MQNPFKKRAIYTTPKGEEMAQAKYLTVINAFYDYGIQALVRH